MSAARVTVWDVVRAAGVSQPTVSLILNGKGQRYSAETRRRVVEAAERLGYRPATNARSMASGKVASLGLLTGTQFDRSVVGPMIPGIQRACREHDLHLVLAEVPDAQLVDAGFVPKILREYAVAGFLIGYTHEIPAPMAGLIERYRIPSVWMNTVRDADAVYLDDEAAGAELTRRLIALGHRRIAFFTVSMTAHYSHPARYAGYARAMADAGLAPLDLRVTDRWMEVDDLAAVPEWLSGPAGRRPTAVVTWEDRDALTLLAWSAQLGLRVPADLSLATFHLAPVTLAACRVMTCCLPFEAVGHAAVEMLLAKLADDSRRPARPVVLPGTIDVGNSAGPPPHD